MSLPETWNLEDELDERERQALTPLEVAVLSRADAGWLARERLEHEVLVLSWEEELDALLETLKRGEPSNVTEAAQADPPGWPNL